MINYKSLNTNLIVVIEINVVLNS